MRMMDSFFSDLSMLRDWSKHEIENIMFQKVGDGDELVLAPSHIEVKRQTLFQT